MTEVTPRQTVEAYFRAITESRFAVAAHAQDLLCGDVG
jgi:hypothetical protein